MFSLSPLTFAGLFMLIYMQYTCDFYVYKHFYSTYLALILR